MSTSGVTAWSLTARDIVKAAMGELAVIAPGTDPDADEEQDCILRLNALLKSWSLRGVTLSRETTGTVTTTGGTAAVTLDAGVRAISSARLIVSATNERQLWPMGRTDYLSLPNKASVGSPTMYYLSRERDAAILYLWPVSATAATIAIDYDRIPETVTDPSETVDIREELQETVYTNLAVRIAGIFGQQPPPELVQRAASLEMAMYDAERPDFYTFETAYA